MKHLKLITRAGLFFNLFIAVAFFASGQKSGAQQPPAATALNDTWNGVFSDDEGNIFNAEFQLKATPDGNITGDIKWTFSKSPNPKNSAKLGLAGIEHVKGKYDADTQLLIFAGYSKDDPDTVISLDKYRLFFSDNGKVIGGITWNNGNWRGLVSFTRAR